MAPRFLFPWPIATIGRPTGGAVLWVWLHGYSYPASCSSWLSLDRGVGIAIANIRGARQERGTRTEAVQQAEYFSLMDCADYLVAMGVERKCLCITGALLAGY